MDTVTLIIVILGIVLSIYFNVCNGRNDASNTIAIPLATHAMKPRMAVIFGAIFCFLGPFLFSTATATTIQKGIVNPAVFTPVLLLVAILSSILWVNFCSHLGIPVSSSHTMVGSLLGTGIAAGGWQMVTMPSKEMIFDMFKYLGIGAAIGCALLLILAFIFHDSKWKFALIGIVVGLTFSIPVAMIAFGFAFGGLLAIFLFICVSPLLGIILSYIVTLIISRVAVKTMKAPARMNKWFQRLQVVGSAFQALSLGGNEAQHAMGFIFAILISAGIVGNNDSLPLWVILLSAGAISIGILTGGWKVIRNLGSGITKILPYQGFSASLTAGSVLSFIVSSGVPVSATHLTTGSILGTGMINGAGSVNWKTVRQMVTAWVITVPCSALVAFILYFIVALIFKCKLWFM